ncbi:NAD-dependent epimerase/dehydratase family protein [Magnetofaba australis]|uniref:Putative NAD-dependent epimerase/dehydratase n=1 Tax=Magnetofaba australis IT-1 TaxID=1434232 RepID=A0A1Y2K373_9PROT|nr:NAD-dependent epimerase/dehydratase family protein [Magnetofaba australis]OSM02117.1 putative NAD-dependent epimerase/dehydratase [Magnetofaba australis IT-1]
MSKPTLVITGGAGFIGSHLAQRMRDRYKLVLFDNLRRDSLQYVPELRDDPDISFIQGDILDRDAMFQAIDGAEAVVHMAAIAGVSAYHDYPLKTLHTNIEGGFNLLDAVRAAGTVKRLIAFSSSEVYGPKAENVNESMPMVSGPPSESRWVYSVSKLALEHAVISFAKECPEVSCSNIRPFNVYGPRQTGEGAISNFCRKLLAGEPLQIYGDGSEVRAWCFVDDLLDAMEEMWECPEASGKSFNIGYPETACTTNELAETLIRVAGRGELKHIPREHTPLPLRKPDITLARTTFGFDPKVGLEEGLKRTLQWFEETGA